MAEYGDQDALPLTAAADLGACQYHIVRMTATTTVNIASDPVNSGLIGVLQNKPLSGAFATVAYRGKSKVVAGGAVTVGALLTCDASGRAATIASGDLKMVFGRALEAAANTGEVFTALLFSPVRWAGAA